MEQLDAFLPKFEALQGILIRLECLENRMPTVESIQSMTEKLASLEAVISKIENMKIPEPIVITQEHKDGKTIVVDRKAVNDQVEWNRLKMLSQFTHMAGKADLIEKEWQKIQQDENDAYFQFQILRDKAESEYCFKKGIAEGIKWCVKHFC